MTDERANNKEAKALASLLFFVREDEEGKQWSVQMRHHGQQMEISGPHFTYDHAEHWMRFAEKIVEPLLAAALAARERAVWEEVAQWCDQEVQRWNPAPENAVALTRQQARAQEAAEIAAWCRHQAEGVKP